MVRKINLTRGENLIKKPHSYARDSKKEPLTNKIIKHLTNTKGITKCYDTNCQSTNIIYDSNRDEVYCHDCGTVLRQGFTDNQDIILKVLKPETPSEQYKHPIEIKSDNEIYTEYYTPDKATA